MLLYKYSKYYLRKYFTSTTRYLNNDKGQKSAQHYDGIQVNILNGFLTIRKHTQIHFNESYSLEQQQQLLNIINNSKAADLQNYGVSETRSKKLLQWREDNGKFQYLHDILRIDGFGVKVANKLLQNLLETSKKPKANSKQTSSSSSSSSLRLQHFVTPNFKDEYCKDIKTIVAVRIGVNIITWSRIILDNLDTNDETTKPTHSNCTVSHWHYENINEKRLHLSDLVYRCLNISQLIPLADCYVFESPQTIQASMKPGSIEQQNVNIQKAQMYGIMGYALAFRKSNHLNKLNKLNASSDDNNITATPADTADTAQHKSTVASNVQDDLILNVFYMKRFLTARLFNHLVGGEKISSEKTVLDMMHNASNTQQLDYIVSKQMHNSVQFPIELCQLFKCATRSQREFLGQALLLNLAFIRLVLLRDAQSITSVTRYVKKPSTS